MAHSMAGVHQRRLTQWSPCDGEILTYHMREEKSASHTWNSEDVTYREPPAETEYELPGALFCAQKSDLRGEAVGSTLRRNTREQLPGNLPEDHP